MSNPNYHRNIGQVFFSLRYLVTLAGRKFTQDKG